MCQFKSAIVLQDEKCKGGFRLLISPWTESHSELCIIHNIRDGARLSFARVEHVPKSIQEAHLVEKYTLRIDEERTPEWFSEEIKEAVTAKMKDYIKSIIVTSEVSLLIGGQFILGPGAKVEVIKESVVENIHDGSVQNLYANVGSMSGSANVGYMSGSVNVGSMSGSAKVGYMSGSAKVGYMYDSAKVGYMYDSAKVGSMYDSAKVGSMYDSANVGYMYGSANVGYMYDSAKVGYMYDSAKVTDDKRVKAEPAKPEPKKKAKKAKKGLAQ